ncbi:NUDIX domain-containing protein [Halobacterium sp. CBA1126]|uniref:NUDIX domain-containing protein n=1 Tax=Halobacterium TaxID=2239 RepID=UPI0012FA5077|nr:NUDIX domain-containing protein [Halobacterium sp. CBA1126]MUV60751.1 NUDIX domain-containing protein [Halobacterium sp. CBA1126]
MPVDDLWYLASRAEQRAERAYHELTDAHEEFVEFERRRSVSRERFRTLAERVERTGAPFGAHTVVYRENGDLALVRHEDVDLWVLPGGGVEAGESFREAAERELAEEAGVEATYHGLAMVTAVTIESGGYSAWGVLPVFEACADDTDLEVRDPDGEISAAAWFAELPEDTRDRRDLQRWRERALS